MQESDLGFLAFNDVRESILRDYPADTHIFAWLEAEASPCTSTHLLESPKISERHPGTTCLGLIWSAKKISRNGLSRGHNVEG